VRARRARTAPVPRPGPAGGTSIPLRRSLLVRLLGASLLIAVCAIAGTAWLAVQTTTTAIQHEQGQILADDATIYTTLVDYAATHPRWDAVSATVDRLARRTHRRITLTAPGAGGRRLADSTSAAAPPHDQPLAVIDPLQVDPALVPDVGADRIDSHALGPFRLSAATRERLRQRARTALGCIVQEGGSAVIRESPAGHPSVVTALPAQVARKLGDYCGATAVAAPTASERTALHRLNALVGRCLSGRGVKDVEIGLDLTPVHPVAAASPTGRAVRTCLDTGRRELLGPYVAPAAQLYVSDAARPGTPSQFALTGPNTTRVAGVTALVLVLAVATTVAVGTRLVRPLRALTSAARQPTDQPYLRLPVTTRDEIGHLTAAFNDLSEHRARTEAQRKAMVSDIAHELRTPLSTIRGWLEATQDGVLTGDDEVTSALLEETLVLQHIVDDLQDLAAADAGALALHPEPVDARSVLQGVATAHAGHAQRAGVELEVRAEDGAWVFADPLRLRQIVGNLVSNAVRHTPSGGRVVLGACRTAEGARIEVSDTGTGIGPQDLPRVFDRFWRAEKSRSRRSGGSGLGLAIVRKLVEAHGGTVEAASTPGSGTVFTLHLPG
jgi:two-component system sensor histidine kinase BaeS